MFLALDLNSTLASCFCFYMVRGQYVCLSLDHSLIILLHEPEMPPKENRMFKGHW